VGAKAGAFAYARSRPKAGAFAYARSRPKAGAFAYARSRPKAGAFAYARRAKAGAFAYARHAANQRSALLTGVSVNAREINSSKSFLNFSREGVSM
jgi:hypothetical protein